MKRFNIICCVLVLLIVYNFGSAFSKVNFASFMFGATKTVIIDAGHGGEDGGAVGVNSVIEKDINLEIALKLQEYFENNFYQVIMIRDEDEDLADENLDTISQRKESDLRNRLEIINNSEAAVVISIHQNYFTESKYSGTQVFYANEDSKSLAETIQSGVVSALQPDNTRLAKFESGKFLLNNSNKPMVIVECGFLSNYDETEKLLDSDYQADLAKAIFNAVNVFLT